MPRRTFQEFHLTMNYLVPNSLGLVVFCSHLIIASFRAKQLTPGPQFDSSADLLVLSTVLVVVFKLKDFKPTSLPHLVLI